MESDTTMAQQAKLGQDTWNLKNGKHPISNKKWQATEEHMIDAGRLIGVSPDNFKKIMGNPTSAIIKAAFAFAKFNQAENFLSIQPLFYDEKEIWWIWDFDLYCWVSTNEIDILNSIHHKLGIDTINAKERNEIIQALKQVSRMRKPKSLPPTCIQFRNMLVDIKTGEEFNSTPDFFSVNPIPYSLHRDRLIETPVMDSIFEQWVGKDHVKKLYQILAYSLLPDYPIHRLFCFIGSGMNGKGCFLRIVEKFVGSSNCCSTELDTLLNSRFEITRLFKKLVCIMGETNFNEMSKTSMLKKLTGQDMIGFEQKGKTPFESNNYAKILIATNNLPETTDKTDGFYRRWLIVDFPHRFSEQQDILSTIPEEEYEILAVKCLMILHDLLIERKFDNEGSIEDRAKTYEEKSNPFDKFFKDNIEEAFDCDIPKWEFEKRFSDWCRANRFRQMSDVTISKKMKERSVQEVKIYKDWFENNQPVRKQVRCWGGIKWKV